MSHHELKYINETLQNEYNTWLTSSDNPNQTGERAYDSYDYYLDSLIDGAIKLNLIKKEDVRVEDIDWLKYLLGLLKESDDFDDYDRTKRGNRGGSSSLKLFIKFIEFKNSRVSEGSKYEKVPLLRNVDMEALNLILYGPPGIGKTYSTVIKAVKIIDGSVPLDKQGKVDYRQTLMRYRELMEKGRIAFTTFHQAYDYEEFIEGIKPDFEADDIKYIKSDGVFKEFCDRAKKPITSVLTGFGFSQSATVWKVSLGGTGSNPTRTDCINNGHIRVGYDSYGKDITDETTITDGKNVLKAFTNDMRVGDIVLSCFSATTIDAIGVITGDYEWHDEYKEYKRLRNVKWLVRNICEDITAINNNKVMTLSTVYRLNISIDDIIKMVNKYEDKSKIEYDYTTPYVFIIDEINRGNVAKIFGELITLIEPSKRLGASEEMTCILPYTKKPFGVPKNVYIIGTMNTADRSLVQLDAALRRRFEFEEMQPDMDLLKDNITMDGIDLRALLTIINERIEALLDREHKIGHSYFIKIDKNSTVTDVKKVFEKNIIPLLQEYFFDDYEAIQKVLGKAFVTDRPNPFRSGDLLYSINCPDDVKAYTDIYASFTVTT